jgi:hypothetical protein
VEETGGPGENHTGNVLSFIVKISLDEVKTFI